MSSENPDTRQRILEATWRLLVADQGTGVRMADIAKAAGVSRQAVYLHFPTRSDLLIATTRHLDEVNDVDARLAASRQAATGVARLDAFIDAWGNYIPVIYPVARALLAAAPTDDAAAAAAADRNAAVRHGCQAAVAALKRDGELGLGYSAREATDILATLLSVGVWEQLRHDCGWSQRRYTKHMKSLAKTVLVAGN